MPASSVPAPKSADVVVSHEAGDPAGAGEAAASAGAVGEGSDFQAGELLLRAASCSAGRLTCARLRFRLSFPAGERGPAAG